MSTSETELAEAMRAARGGDRKAYAFVLAEIARLARPRIGRTIGRGHADLEDVVQEVLLAVHRKNATWDDRLPLLPWIHAVCDHKAIDAARRRGREARIVATDIALDDVQERVSQPQEEARLSPDDLKSSLARLPSGQRAVVQAIGVEGQSIKGTAKTLSMSEGSVRVAFHRGLKALRRLATGETRPDRGPEPGDRT